MSRSSRLLTSSIKSSLMVLALAMIFLSGCQGTALDYQKGKSVEGRIPLIEQGQKADSWQSRDLTIDYQYTRNGGSIALSGKVRYSEMMKGNFLQIDYFHLDVIFADAQGRMLDMQAVDSSANTDPNDPETFSTTLVAPPDTVAMAFSYRGVAREGGSRGGGSSTYFWNYPIR